MDDAKLLVKLSVIVDGQTVKARIEIANKSQTAVELFRPLLGPDETLSMNLFKIKDAQDKLLKYRGILAKRRLAKSDFVSLAPGATMAADFRLDQHYDFPPRGGAFKVTFSAYNQSLNDDDPLMPLRSNEVVINLPAK